MDIDLVTHFSKQIWKTALITEAASASKALVNSYQTKMPYNPGNSHLSSYSRENLKSYLAFLLMPYWPLLYSSSLSHGSI